jgi:hypothetical protein
LQLRPRLRFRRRGFAVADEQAAAVETAADPQQTPEALNSAVVEAAIGTPEAQMQTPPHRQQHPTVPDQAAKNDQRRPGRRGEVEPQWKKKDQHRFLTAFTSGRPEKIPSPHRRHLMIMPTGAVCKEAKRNFRREKAGSPPANRRRAGHG